jgi:TorA maturation chaperone TorD
MNTTELATHTKTKEDCFRLLSACFYEPQKKLFLEENLFGNLTEGLRRVSPRASDFSAAMEKSIHNYTAEELSVEYSKLFVGPFELLAPPYGSVYLDEGRRVMGDSTMKVIETYQEEGLSKNDDFKDLPDHIAVEMEFVSYLIYKEREAAQRADIDTARQYVKKQEYFLDTYLRPWVPLFCEKIKERTENSFYSALADCVSTFIADLSAEHSREYKL